MGKRKFLFVSSHTAKQRGKNLSSIFGLFLEKIFQFWELQILALKLLLSVVKIQR